LTEAGDQIIRWRRELLPQFSPLAQQAYRVIASQAEELQLSYVPSVKADFTVELSQNRNRERAFRATMIGPHRDDLALLLNGRPAAQFGSEGQKRTLAIALKMAQAEHLASLHGTPPVLLIDDIMGELDLRRRSGLMPLLLRARHARGQVFMTVTEENWPEEMGREARKWIVSQGKIS